MLEDSGGRRFRRKTTMVMTEINVTPFVDVMLVLLIIFIVTAPLMQSGLNIDLPKEETGALEIREENVVAIRGDGAMFFNDKRIDNKDLRSKMKNLAALSAEPEVFLHADRRISYGKAMNVMAIIKKAGITKLGMVTEMPTEPRKKKR